MRNPVFTILSIILPALTMHAQGTHVFSGGEFTNYAIVDIATAGGQTWSTDRAALPGYFSVINTASFTGCSDAANINGYIKKYGNNNFIFPVGNGSDLRTLEISSPATPSDAYATAWIAGDPGSNLDPTAPNAGPHTIFSVASPVVAVSPAGQWDWQVGDAGNLGITTTGTGAGLTVTVSIPDMTAFAATPNLRLVGWDGTQWIDLSGGPAATGNTENSTLSGTMKAGITAVAVGSVTWVLPLKLESFYTNASNCDAMIWWTTSNEVNTDKFIVEQSIDNISYQPVTTVKAKSNSTTSSYHVLVTQPAAIAYYRLKMIDYGGAYTYSKISVCRTTCSAAAYMMVYPNPVIETGVINLSFGTAYKGKAILSVTTALGQPIIHTEIQVHTFTNLVPVNVSRFAAGTYFMSLLTDEGVRIGTVQKFIKQ
jgi:hypothetical protein